MRCSLCEWIINRAFVCIGLSGPKYEVEEESTMSEDPPFRRCNNIKSQKNPDSQCPYAACAGDYCSRHSKNPRPFKGRGAQPNSPITRSAAAAARRIQDFWRRVAPLLRFSQQGPAANALDLATNDTELFSLDKISAVPPVYRFSFSDERRAIWLFDIRTLAHSIGTGATQKNPYTRDPLSTESLEKFYKRVAWLRDRKYQIRHVSSDVLSEEQIWNQKILDVFLKIEALGYYMSIDWFHQLRATDHVRFYARMASLWEWRLDLTAAQKEAIVPGHLTQGSLLFRFFAQDMIHRDLAWWQRQNLALMNSFVSRGALRENRKLGAMYVIMALAYVSDEVAESFPWIADVM